MLQYVCLDCCPWNCIKHWSYSGAIQARVNQIWIIFRGWTYMGLYLLLSVVRFIVGATVGIYFPDHLKPTARRDLGCSVGVT